MDAMVQAVLVKKMALEERHLQKLVVVQLLSNYYWVFVDFVSTEVTQY